MIKDLLFGYILCQFNTPFKWNRTYSWEICNHFKTEWHKSKPISGYFFYYKSIHVNFDKEILKTLCFMDEKVKLFFILDIIIFISIYVDSLSVNWPVRLLRKITDLCINQSPLLYCLMTSARFYAAYLPLGTIKHQYIPSVYN